MNQKFLVNKDSNSLNLFYLNIPVAFITIFILGCGPSISFIQTGPPKAAKSKNCLIEVFNSKLPERKYQELGVLEGEGQYGYDTFVEVLPKLKEEACEKGGDAIIIKTIQKLVSGKDDENIYVTATVIKWVN